MIVTKNNLSLTTLVFLIVLVFGCKIDKESNDDEIYKVLSEVINNRVGLNAIIPPAPPPYPEDGFLIEKVSLNTSSIKGKWVSKEDSIKYFDKYEEVLSNFKKGLKNREFVVAVSPYLSAYSNLISTDTLSNYYNPLIHKLIKIKEKRPIDINKIDSQANVRFIKTPIQENGSIKTDDWELFDHSVSCSQIVFNDNKDRAIVIIGFSRSRLDGYSTLILLEKKNKKWSEIHEIGLTIS